MIYRIAYCFLALIGISCPFVEEGQPAALGPVAADYGINSYPSLVLIDPDGNVVGKVGLKELKERMSGRTDP